MKRHFFKTLVIAVAAATFFASCDDQHEEPVVKSSAAISVPTSSSITIDSETSRATTGILHLSATPVPATVSKAGVFRHEVGLLTEGFSTSFDETEGLIVNGTGHSVWLQVYSQSQALEEGIYSFTGSQENGKPFDLWYGAVDANDKNFLFTEGQLIVAKNGKDYSLEIEGKITTAGSDKTQTIRASYNGPLTAFASKN